MGTLSHGRPLAMEVLPVLDVVDLGDELLFDGFTCMKTIEGLTDHQFEVVVGLLYLTDVDRLQL